MCRGDRHLNSENLYLLKKSFNKRDQVERRNGAVVRTLASRHHMLVEFVGSLLCSERFFSGYSGFPLSSKTNLYNLIS